MEKKTRSTQLQDGLLRVAGIIQNNIYVSSISQGMMSTMPVLMGGALIQLIYSLPITPWVEFLQNIGIYDLLTGVVDVCNLTGVFMSFAIAKTLGEKKGVDAFQAGVISLLCFLLVTPMGMTEAGAKYIDTSYLGAMGVITAMLVALTAPTIFAFIIKRNLVIKLPESVPVFVSNTFKIIPPALLTIVPFIALKGILGASAYGSVTDFIYAMLQVPLTSVGNSLGGHLILLFFMTLMWWCGVHGTLVILPFMQALMMAPLLENIEAVNAGLSAPNTLSFMTFFTVVQFIGGPGCLIGLVVCLAFFSKSERYRAQGKISLVPGIFNIIEPTVYGLPVVLNPILLIPFLGLPLVVQLLMYLCLQLGLFATPVVNMSVMVMPGPIVGFLLGGGVGLGVFCLLACLLSIIVYYPFVKLLDRQELKEEALRREEQTAGELEAG